MLAAIAAFISQKLVRDKNRIAYEMKKIFPCVLLCCTPVSIMCWRAARGEGARRDPFTSHVPQLNAALSSRNFKGAGGGNGEQLELQWLQLSGEALKPVNGRGSLHQGTARGPYHWPDGKRRDTTKRAAASGPRAKSKQRQGQRFRAGKST